MIKKNWFKWAKPSEPGPLRACEQRTFQTLESGLQTFIQLLESQLQTERTDFSILNSEEPIRLLIFD